MALDEALLCFRRPTPTLRLYSWHSPCLSIGYSQPVRRDVDLDACRRLGIGLVRRPTGGGAILHDAELTYSLVAPEAHPAVSGSVLESYCKISQGLVTGLEYLGIESKLAPGERQTASIACLQNPSAYELTVSGRKIVGSAQCRQQGFLLQHGSVLIGLDRQRTAEVLRTADGSGPDVIADDLQRRATCLQEALDHTVSFDEVAEALAAGFREALNLDLELTPPEAEEWEEASRLCRDKYSNDAWTMAR